MKSMFKSKTLTVNLLALIATISTAFGLDLGLGEAAQAQIATGIMAIVNIVLRFVTNTGIKTG